jgi:hypothetical protein
MQSHVVGEHSYNKETLDKVVGVTQFYMEKWAW